MILAILKQIASALAAQFGPGCEVIIYDLSDLEHSLVHIENGHVTNRQIGDPPSHIVLDACRKDASNLRDEYSYLTKTKDGKTLRSSTIFIREEPEGAVKYILGINYDMTGILSCQESVRSLYSLVCGDNGLAGQPKEEPRQIFTNVSELLDSLIAESVALIGKPASEMTKEEKIEAIRFLDKSGTFLITKSGDRVSEYFGISKFTLYNYLKSE